VPQEANQDTYLVLDDFGGRLGRAWRETDEEDTDRETLIRYLMGGQYNHPMRIIAYTAEVWSRDVTMDIADEPLPDQCLQSAKADVRPPRRKSGLDPTRT